MYFSPNIQKDEVTFADFQYLYHHFDQTRFIYVTLSISTASKKHKRLNHLLSLPLWHFSKMFRKYTPFLSPIKAKFPLKVVLTLPKLNQSRN